MVSSKLLFLTLLALITGIASAQSNTTVVTDVLTELNGRLSSQVVTKQRTVKERKTRCYRMSCELSKPAETLSLRPSADAPLMLCRECEEYDVERVENYSAAPTVASVQIVQLLNLAIREAGVVSLPERVIVTSDDLINCSKATFTSQRTLTQNVQTGYSVTVTRSASTTNSLSGNISAKLPGDVTVGGSATVTTQVSTATAQQDSRSETATQSQTINVSVQTDTKLRVEYRTTVRRLNFPFGAQVIIDGPLDSNLSSVTKVSDLLKDEQARAFPLEGFIIVDAASAGRVVTSEQKPTVLDCMGSVPNEEIRIRSFTTTINARSKSSLLTEKQALPNARKAPSPLLKSLIDNQPLSYPGAWCHTQPCNLPLDGNRKVCYRDENLYCNDCRDEPDSVCAPEPPQGNSSTNKKQGK